MPEQLAQQLLTQIKALQMQRLMVNVRLSELLAHKELASDVTLQADKLVQEAELLNLDHQLLPLQLKLRPLLTRYRVWFEMSIQTIGNGQVEVYPGQEDIPLPLAYQVDTAAPGFQRTAEFEQLFAEVYGHLEQARGIHIRILRIQTLPAQNTYSRPVARL